MRKNEIQRILEEHDFNVVKCKDCWEISRYTPAGEDWNLCFEKLEDIVEYAENYDPEEDFNVWIEARIHGMKDVPPPMQLWEDQVWKQNTLNEIAREITCQN